MPEEQTYQYKLNFKIKKGYTGDIVGKCMEFPAIIVQGKNMTNLYNKAQKALFLYLNTFPEKRKEFLKKYSSPIVDDLNSKVLSLNAKQLEESWNLYSKILDKQNEWKQVELLAITK
jgi:hypothetical protein